MNLVLVAEGEEEIASPHFHNIVTQPDVKAALDKAVGIIIPSASQSIDGATSLSLGAKGVVELQLISSGEKWGRGPSKDVHSSLKANVDSPVWHLIKALEHAGFRGRTNAGDRWLVRECEAADGAPEGTDRRRRRGIERSRRHEDARHQALVQG